MTLRRVAYSIDAPPLISIARCSGAAMASAVVIARIGFALLGLVTFITVVSTIVSDGSPFRRELLTPWMVATLIDFYVNVTLIAVWVWYKEQSWFSALIWTVLLICFGSITTCWLSEIKAETETMIR